MCGVFGIVCGLSNAAAALRLPPKASDLGAATRQYSTRPTKLPAANVLAEVRTRRRRGLSAGFLKFNRPWTGYVFWLERGRLLDTPVESSSHRCGLCGKKRCCRMLPNWSHVVSTAVCTLDEARSAAFNLRGGWFCVRQQTLSDRSKCSWHRRDQGNDTGSAP